MLYMSIYIYIDSYIIYIELGIVYIEILVFPDEVDIFQTHSGVIYLILISTCLLHPISFTRSTVEFSHTLLNGVRQLLPEVMNLTNVYHNCHYHTIPVIFLEDSQFSCKGLEVNGSLWQRFYLVQL